MKKSGIYRKESSYKEFIISLLTIGLSYGLYKGILDNYLAEIVSIKEFDRGVTEFFRELPGFLLMFILALLSQFSAERIFRIGGVIMFFGIMLIASVPVSKTLVILAIFIYSTGEHIQLGMKNTISLDYSEKGHSGEALGVQNAISNFGNIFGYIAIMVLFFFIRESEKAFRAIFVVSALILAFGVAVSFRMKGSSKTDETKRRFYFRRKYAKYYMLEVFYGARKQIFFTFGPYVLILFYGADASIISFLFAISALACFLLAPAVGRIIDRIGYRTVMIADTLILIIVCFFYGFAHHLFPMHIAFIVCCVNYILDSVISLASMASNIYVQDISDSPEEVRATINTGISVNHFISIIIALFGGLIWQKTGIEVLFSLSALLGLLNSIYAATIKTKKVA